MHVVAQVRGGGVDGLACERPLRAVCRDCDHVEHWSCDTYGCGPCGETKRRRLIRVIEDGAAGQLASGLRGYFVTLTAPGESPHRRLYQGRRPDHRPECDCWRWFADGGTKGRWNAQESACWNRLRTALTRDRQMQFTGAVETQKRGLLHRHLVIFTDGPLEQPEVQALAIAAGYGCAVDVQPLTSAATVARYVSKYVSKASTDRPEVPWAHELVDLETGELVERESRATYRLWSASHRWGVTMRQVRQVAALQARARAEHLRSLADLLGLDVTDLARARQGAAEDASTSQAGP